MASIDKAPKQDPAEKVAKYIETKSGRRVVSLIVGSLVGVCAFAGADMLKEALARPTLEELEADLADANEALDSSITIYESRTSAECNEVLTRYYERFGDDQFEAKRTFEADYIALYGEADPLTTQLIVEMPTEEVGPCGNSLEAIASRDAYYDVHARADQVTFATSEVADFEKNNWDNNIYVDAFPYVVGVAVAAAVTCGLATTRYERQF